MRLIRKTFSEEELKENKRNNAKIAAGVVGGTLAAAGGTYGGLKLAQRSLKNRAKNAEEAVVRASKELADYKTKNVSGLKNKVRNLFGGRKKEIAEQLNRLEGNVSVASKVKERVANRANNVNNLVGRIEAPVAKAGKVVSKSAGKVGEFAKKTGSKVVSSARKLIKR